MKINLKAKISMIQHMIPVTPSLILSSYITPHEIVRICFTAEGSTGTEPQDITKLSGTLELDPSKAQNIKLGTVFNITIEEESHKK